MIWGCKGIPDRTQDFNIILLPLFSQAIENQTLTVLFYLQAYRTSLVMSDISKKEKIAVIDWLIENFPNAFFKKSSEVKPLQIGIFEDILDFYERLDAPPFSKKLLKESLNYYSSSPAYLKCQQPGSARVDLYGNEIEEVSSDQAKYAYQRYQERYQTKTDTP